MKMAFLFFGLRYSRLFAQRILAVLFLSAMLTTCGIVGPGDPTAGNPSVAVNSAPYTGDQCPDGGITVETGIDENGNGLLDPSEVDETQIVCHGTDGATGDTGTDGLNSLISITGEASGDNCAHGGTKIEVGLDDNNDGLLDPAEVDSTAYVCDGANGDGDSWATKSDKPTSRGGSTSSVVNGKIYVVGGHDGISGATNTVEEYDPATDAWTTKTSIPTARHVATNGVVNGKIYVIGGSPGSSGVLNAVEEYDPATDTWTIKTAMPTARNNMTSGVVNGKIYVIGGDSDSGVFNTVEEYDPATDSWTNCGGTCASMPTARGGSNSIAVNGKIYVVGGHSGGSVLNTVEEYDPATDTWTTKSAMPTARTYTATSVVNGKIYVTGGWDPDISSYFDTVEEYDPATDIWTNCGGSCASMPTARYLLTSSTVNGKIYAIGGRGGEYADVTGLYTLEEYTPPH